MRTHLILSMSLLALVACGGSQHGSSGGGSVAPPPELAKKAAPADPKAKTAATEQPKVEVSKDAKADYVAASQFFKDNDKGGAWSESACRSAADKFQSVSRAHPELIQAAFMVGLSYERCNMLSDAESAYNAASHMKGNDNAAAMAVSSLGTLYFKAGKVDGAKQYWDSALKTNGKLVGAHIGLASIELEQMRKINNPKDKKWQDLESDARWHLSNALGVESDSVEAYTVFGLIYLEGYQANKNRLDLAKTLLDEGKKRNEKYAPLQNAYGLLYMRRASLNQALAAFNAAVEIDPKFVEARINVGQVTLGFRKYDTARDMFAKVIELSPKSYDAYIGLGIALRGLKDLDGAEAQYKKAIEVDPRRGEAYYNLAILYKEFRSSKEDFIASYKKAKEYFQQFLTMQADQADKNEAKEQIAMIDKTVQNFMKAPPPPAAAPAQPPANRP
jgi:tetratricopeptide (TPR) repeat protein